MMDIDLPNRPVPDACHLQLDSLMVNTGGDIAFLRELIDGFFVRLPSILQELAATIRRGDAIGIATIVHDLSGSAAEFGAHRVLELTREMERLARSAGSEAAAALFPQLDSAFVEMKGAWEEIQRRGFHPSGSS